jgi:hypothetical protein
MTTAPAPGTRCSMCLCCDAVILFAGEALCAACDDGTHPGSPAGIRLKSESAPPPQPSAAPALEPKKKASMAPRIGRNLSRRIEPEIRRAIAEADSSISNSKLAHQYGISDYLVKTIRGNVLKSESAFENILDGVSLPMAAASTAEPELRATTTGHELRAALVILSVPERTIDAWWDSLDLEGKAALFTANYKIQVEGFVS